MMVHALTRPQRDVIRRFTRLDSGAVAPLMAFLMLALIGCMGIAIDTGRAVVVHARLSSALDSAGLAVASRVSTVDATTEAKKFVDANFALNFAGAKVTSVTAKPNADNSVIALTATATMPTVFMKLFGQKLVTVNTASEVTRKLTGLEVVMALDNTGSMEQSKSMPALRDAANLLVDQLFGSQTTAKNLYVGLVPFSNTVNIGTARPTWMKPVTDLTSRKDYMASQWQGCVEARYGGLDQTDDPPLSTLSNTQFPYYWYPDDDTWNNWVTTYFGRKYYNIDYTSDAIRQTGPSAFCPSIVTPMTSVKKTITDGITAMKPGGATHINLGAVWAWRMISPQWRGYWGSATLPLDYNTPKMAKAVVIMTDGQNTVYDSPAQSYTAYGYLSANRLGTTNATDGKAALNARLTTVCNSMKATGITIYAVAFNIPAAEVSVKALLQSCATSTANYFDATDQTKLKAAFQTIGDSLSNLRVSK